MTMPEEFTFDQYRTAAGADMNAAKQGIKLFKARGLIVTLHFCGHGPNHLPTRYRKTGVDPAADRAARIAAQRETIRASNTRGARARQAGASLANVWR